VSSFTVKRRQRVPSDGQQALANRLCRFCLTWRTIIRSTGDMT
jgi:hypothetical protein